MGGTCTEVCSCRAVNTARIGFCTCFMNAFQQPAQSVAIRILVPKELYAKASGMALMFSCTAVLGTAASIYWYGNKDIRALDGKEEE